MTNDYSIQMADRAGRSLAIPINGASIDELIADGYDRNEAREIVQGNAFQKAVDAGRIGHDAWLESTTRSLI